MPSLSAGLKFGSSTPSSLVRAATTYTREVTTYNDTLQKYNFDNNPTDAQFQQYSQYLQSRINNLQSSGTIADQTKALTLSQEIQTAYKKNVGFNIKNESISVLAGNATDQQKLDYIASIYPTAVSTGDMTFAQSLEGQAYSLQQSINYQQQTAATAAQTQFTADQTATKAGYTNSINLIDSQWKNLVTAFKSGDNGAVQQAINDFTKTSKSSLSALGITLPTGSQATMATLAQAVLQAKYAYYTNEAITLGPGADGQAAQINANDIASGNSTIASPTGGNLNIQQVGQWVASANLYSTSTNDIGQNTQVLNHITGYGPGKVETGMQMVNGQLQPIYSSQAIPTSQGNANAIKATTPQEKSLANLGFTIVSNSTKDSTTQIQVTKQSLNLLGNSNPNLKVGDIVTMLPTNNGTGFQFLDSNHQAHGISFDTAGKAALYSMNSGTGQWNFTNSQPGYNVNPVAKSTPPATLAYHPTAQNITSNIMGSNTPFSLGGMNFTGKPTMTQRAGGGFNFTNAQGQAISAYTYAQQTGQQFRNVLTQMSGKGDAFAGQALQYAGNDGAYNPSTVTQSVGKNWNSLIWGSNVHTQTPQYSRVSGAGPAQPSQSGGRAPGIPSAPSLPGL